MSAPGPAALPGDGEEDAVELADELTDGTGSGNEARRPRPRPRPSATVRSTTEKEVTTTPRYNRGCAPALPWVCRADPILEKPMSIFPATDVDVGS